MRRVQGDLEHRLQKGQPIRWAGAMAGRPKNEPGTMEEASARDASDYSGEKHPLQTAWTFWFDKKCSSNNPEEVSLLLFVPPAAAALLCPSDE